MPSAPPRSSQGYERSGSRRAGECSSWYKTASGKITNNWSDDTAAYRRRTARPRFGDYAFG